MPLSEHLPPEYLLYIHIVKENPSLLLSAGVSEADFLARIKFWAVLSWACLG